MLPLAGSFQPTDRPSCLSKHTGGTHGDEIEQRSGRHGGGAVKKIVEIPRQTPVKDISQDAAAELLLERSLTSRQLKRLQANGLKILRAMGAGAEIAPGAIYLEVVEVEDGGSVKRMLLVDDRPVDDVG